jgi:hypothetical protein
MLTSPRTLLTEHKAAIDKLKEMLCSAPLLVRPDPNREFKLHTEWSAAVCGAILQQRGDAGEEPVISYASRSNNKPGSNYCSYAGECLAAVWGVRYHRVYLYGRRSLLYTDHWPLEWLMTSQMLTGMHAWWTLTLQEFDFEVKYRKGLVNMNADGLSRNPQPETEDLMGAREHDDLPGELVGDTQGPAASVMLAWQAWAADDLPLSIEEAGGELWEPGEPAEPKNLAFPGNIDYGPPDVELPVPAEQGLGGKGPGR